MGGSCVIVGNGLEEGRWINKCSILFHWSGFPVTGSSCDLGFVPRAHTDCDNSDYNDDSGTPQSSALCWGTNFMSSKG